MWVEQNHQKRVWDKSGLKIKNDLRLCKSPQCVLFSQKSTRPDRFSKRSGRGKHYLEYLPSQKSKINNGVEILLIANKVSSHMSCCECIPSLVCILTGKQFLKYLLPQINFFLFAEPSKILFTGNFHCLLGVSCCKNTNTWRGVRMHGFILYLTCGNQHEWKTQEKLWWRLLNFR